MLASQLSRKRVPKWRRLCDARLLQPLSTQHFLQSSTNARPYAQFSRKRRYFSYLQLRDWRSPFQMAPRRGADIEPEEPQLGGLVFNEPLSWRAGKPIPTGELLRRLDTLATELREMDQEETDKDSLTNVAKELAGQNLLGHKDKGVRAFTACCLVDVLKICAPDAPFTPTQLKVCRIKLGKCAANTGNRTSLLSSLPRHYPLCLTPHTPTIHSINTSWYLWPKSRA